VIERPLSYPIINIIIIVIIIIITIIPTEKLCGRIKDENKTKMKWKHISVIFSTRE